MNEQENGTRYKKFTGNDNGEKISVEVTAEHLGQVAEAIRNLDPVQTEIHLKPTREEKAQYIKQIDALKLEWKDEHAAEFHRLAALFSADKSPDFFALILPLMPPCFFGTDAKKTLTGLIETVRAYRREWAQVLDSSARPSQAKPTAAQKKTWPAYHALIFNNQNARRFWLFVMVSYLRGARVALPAIQPIDGEAEAVAICTSPHAQALTKLNKKMQDAARRIEVIDEETKSVTTTAIVTVKQRLKHGGQRRVYPYIVTLTRDRDFTPATERLHDFLVRLFTEQNTFMRCKSIEQRNALVTNNTVFCSLESYMRVQGKPLTPKNRQREREIMQHSAKNLFNAIVRGATIYGDEAESRVIDLWTYDTKHDGLVINFAALYAQMLASSFVYYSPEWAFAIDAGDPALYALAKKLATHYSIDSNHRAGNYNRIGVKTLFEDKKIFPDYDDRHPTRHTHERLREMLDKLENQAFCHSSLFTWAFCTKDGKAIPKPEHDYTSDDISDWITFEFSGYPDPTLRLAARDKEKAAKERAKKNIAKKQEKQAGAGI